ncbi:MAG: PEP-CTERM sorting domain-containing protein [Tepidisphaeraceae bacterium]|jgi:hypothetical protein
MRNTKRCIMAGMFVSGLTFIPGLARAQSAPASDYLLEILLGGQGQDPSQWPGISANITNAQNFSIPETPTEGNFIYQANVAARDFDLYEAPPAQYSPISDRLHIDPFTVNIESDSDTTTGQDIPLPRRPGAVLIPASALESFFPVSVTVTSDGDQSGTGSQSDSIEITQGGYLDQVTGTGVTGNVVMNQVIPEPGFDPSSEIVPFTIPAISFDVEEPGSTGGAVISDYVDMPYITGEFISSDFLSDYPPLPNGPNMAIYESAITGGGYDWSMGFSSDVPEPGSIALLGSTLLFGFVRRRR